MPYSMLAQSWIIRYDRKMRVLFERVLYDNDTKYVCANYKGFIPFLHISTCDENYSNTKTPHNEFSKWRSNLYPKFIFFIET